MLAVIQELPLTVPYEAVTSSRLNQDARTERRALQVTVKVPGSADLMQLSTAGAVQPVVPAFIYANDRITHRQADV